MGLRRTGRRRGRPTLPRYGFAVEGGRWADVAYPDMAKPSWADALSRMATTGEMLVVDMAADGTTAERKVLRKRVRASINRTARRKLLAVASRQEDPPNLGPVLLVWIIQPGL